MTTSVTISHVTHDPATDEWVLYLVEDGPWPTSEKDWPHTLRRIQKRVYDAIDVVVDGQLAKRFPDSLKKAVRVQIDSPSGIPSPLAGLIVRFQQALRSDEEVGLRSRASEFIDGLRIVSGHEMGRFGVRENN
jgi:hypothetical protein